jgi:hypothetical protein
MRPRRAAAKKQCCTLLGVVIRSYMACVLQHNKTRMLSAVFMLPAVSRSSAVLLLPSVLVQCMLC